ncbi:hypothetical protein F5Y18DRAFT_424897 [Xylariaceae sp. FL1019]|nr:hypothetical protein F5Y18DRAFT_424897 [Xylariaceae sp. FL1019]
MDPRQNARALTVCSGAHSQPIFSKPEDTMMTNRGGWSTRESPRPQSGFMMSNSCELDNFCSTRSPSITTMEGRGRSLSIPLNMYNGDGHGRNDLQCHHVKTNRCRTAPPSPRSLPPYRVKDPRDTTKPVAVQVVELQNPVTPLWCLGTVPTYIDCPFCHNRAITRIVKEGSFAFIPHDGPVKVLAPPDGPVQVLAPSDGEANALQVESKYTTRQTSRQT